MLDYLRKLDPSPREVRRFQKARAQASLRLSASNGSDPSDEAVAGEMGVAVVKYRKLALIAEASMLVSADLPGFDCPAARQDFNLAAALQTLALDDAIRKLPRIEFIVIVALRAGETIRTIAERLHVTQGRVSQIKSRAILRLRSALGVSQAPRA